MLLASMNLVHTIVYVTQATLETVLTVKSTTSVLLVFIIVRLIHIARTTLAVLIAFAMMDFTRKGLSARKT